VRPTVPGFSVAPMTATVFGEKNTSSGCFRLRFSVFLEGLLGACIFGICLWSERGLIEGLDYVQRIEPVLACDGFDIAIIAGGAITESVKYGDGFRMTLFHVTDDHVTADQLIESKHWLLPRVEAE
jgi:hypothetical protein